MKRKPWVAKPPPRGPASVVGSRYQLVFECKPGVAMALRLTHSDALLEHQLSGECNASVRAHVRGREGRRKPPAVTEGDSRIRNRNDRDGSIAYVNHQGRGLRPSVQP